MKIIISPAKKMNTDDSLEWNNLPAYLDKSQQVLDYLRGLSREEAQRLWKCNDQITSLNLDRLKDMDLNRGLSPAILTYDGIQYKYMAPGVLDRDCLSWIEDNLRILSGFYGILRPMDGIVPYRLEMQAKAQLQGYKSLYEYWGRSLYEELTKEDHVIINLASKEYSKAIEAYLTSEDRYITCLFADEINGKLVQKGTFAKMARGEMVRYLAEINAKEPEQAKGFNRLDFTYREDLSTPEEYVFTRINCL